MAVGRGFRERARWLLGAAAACAWLAVPASAAATDYHVNDGSDMGDGVCDADCTLRDAVGDAGNNDTVIIDPDIDPALTDAGGGQLTIAASITIRGQGANATTITTDATPAAKYRVFDISSGTVEIQDLAITNGRAPDGSIGEKDGGAIRNAGTLTVRRVTISDSVAGNPEIPPMVGESGGNGGGIATSGALTVRASTITDNQAGAGIIPATGGGGGGIAVTGAGSLTVLNSTIYSNDAGGGLISSGSGGGILHASTGPALLINTTIAANATGTAGPSPGTGGGIHRPGAGSLTLRGTLLGSNVRTGASGPTGSNCGGSGYTDAGANLSFPADPTCPAGFITADPLLGPLASNGGPTGTMAVGPGGGAVDRVVDCTGPDGVTPISFDQRGEGFPRLLGAACDIGAFESSPVPPGTAPTGAALGTTSKKKCRKGFRLKKVTTKKGKRKKKCVRRKKRRKRTK